MVVSCYIKALDGRLVYDAQGYPAVEAQVTPFGGYESFVHTFFAIVTNPLLEYAASYYSATRDSAARNSSGRQTTENKIVEQKSTVYTTKPQPTAAQNAAPPYSSRLSSFEYDAKLHNDWINSQTVAEAAVFIINEHVKPAVLKQQFQIDCVKQAQIDHCLITIAESIQPNFLPSQWVASLTDDLLNTALCMATMAVSMAACRAGAHAQYNMPLFCHIGHLGGWPEATQYQLPVPHIVLLGGGARAGGRVKSVACRTISILPVGCKSFAEAAKFGTELFQLIIDMQQQRRKRALTARKSRLVVDEPENVLLSDEGSIVPQKRGMEDILKLLTSYVDEHRRQQQLIDENYQPISYKLALHIDADVFYHAGKSKYYLELPVKPPSPPLIVGGTKNSDSPAPTSVQHVAAAAAPATLMSTLTADELFNHIRDLLRVYPIASLTDAFAQQDLQAWKNAVLELKITLPSSLQIVADRFIASQPLNINRYAAINRYCSSATFRLNQLSTVSEMIIALEMMRLSGIVPVAAQARHESEDTFICDAAVGLHCAQIKLGAPVRGENIAKYNRLVCIEDQLKQADSRFTSEYAGNKIT